MELEKIIENHTAAIGGFEAIEGIKSLQITFHLIEPTYQLDGLYTVDRTNRVRVDIFSDNERVFTEGFNGSFGWQLPHKAKLCFPTSPEGTKALLHGIENQLFGLHELQNRGHHLELVGQEKLENTIFYVINVKYADGHSLQRFINPDSWLIERSREQKALHPDIDPTQVVVETQYSDFQRVGGLLRSFREVQTNLSTSEILQSTTTRKLVPNPNLPPDFFNCPFPIAQGQLT